MRPQTYSDEIRAPVDIFSFSSAASGVPSFTLPLNRSPVEKESSSGYFFNNLPH